MQWFSNWSINQNKTKRKPSVIMRCFSNWSIHWNHLKSWLKHIFLGPKPKVSHPVDPGLECEFVFLTWSQEMLIQLVRQLHFENHCYKGIIRTEDLKCSRTFESPEKHLKNINVWFFSQRFQIDCSKEGPRPPHSLNSPNVQQGLKTTALGRGKIKGERLVQSSPGKK